MVTCVSFSSRQPYRAFPFKVFPSLEDLLREQRERTDRVEHETSRVIPHVFHRNGGEAIRWMRDPWIGANKRAGLGGGTRETGYVFHDLRRDAVSNLVRAGVAEKTAQKSTGHKDRHILDRYNLVDETVLSAGVEKLAAFHGDYSRQGSRTAIPLEAARGTA